MPRLRALARAGPQEVPGRLLFRCVPMRRRCRTVHFEYYFVGGVGLVILLQRPRH